MASACVLGMILMIVALLALSRDKKKSSVREIAYLQRSLFSGAAKTAMPKSSAKSASANVTVFPGNVSRVRLMTIHPEAAELQADKEVM
jgi:hypothetical protein